MCYSHEEALFLKWVILFLSVNSPDHSSFLSEDQETQCFSWHSPMNEMNINEEENGYHYFAFKYARKPVRSCAISKEALIRAFTFVLTAFCIFMSTLFP